MASSEATGVGMRVDQRWGMPLVLFAIVLFSKAMRSFDIRAEKLKAFAGERSVQ